MRAVFLSSLSSFFISFTHSFNLRRTLATKKRRILHVVADSWADSSDGSSGAGGGGGGGHFERRISFGYDADLARVRAEFDGEILRVIIPRRVPVGMVGLAPVGR